MWIKNLVSKPLRKGYYKTLVDIDGFGNLVEVDNQLFNGHDWDIYESINQLICYWKADKEDYKIISNKLEEEFNNFLDSDTRF